MNLEIKMSDYAVIVCRNRAPMKYCFIYAAEHTEEKPKLTIVAVPTLSQRPGAKVCEAVSVSEDFPENGKPCFWSRGTHRGMARYRVEYRGEFYCYILEDNTGWPWVEVLSLNLCK